ncbi:phage tail protein [Novosphingobium umbonatum]|uniref:Phage tail protein n=1 Tax=Novosphingobium umbonatum TaxID=1908524 RepID=A0A437N1X4_9SPHN|nr:phage tail sheath subtilisin-like domain-containing protein [Novosphingobium umbonatum]RVU03921.1 phage tail protein [Novosphingobium umbonatum]
MTHGLTLTESATTTRSIVTNSLAVIGLVATASAAAGAATTALNEAFPLNTPVLVTNIDEAVGKAGTGGTLASALEAIGDITTPLVVVVRVAAGATDAETQANVIGGYANGAYTGLQALLAAEAVVGVRPRILGAPGLDTQEVVEELVSVAKRLRGRVYARALGETIAEVNTYRANFGHRELTLIWPNTSATIAGDAVARALALRAYIDETTGWHKTISNVALTGVIGITKDVHFDLLDSSTDAGVLNDHDIVTIIRTSAGFRFWGNTTCADDANYKFESTVRTLHALQDIIQSTVQPYMDSPMSLGLVKDLMEDINDQFADLATDGWIMGAEVFFDKDANPANQLAQGRPTFRLEWTPVAPLQNPTVKLNLTDYYYTGFADAVNA